MVTFDLTVKMYTSKSSWFKHFQIYYFICVNVLPLCMCTRCTCAWCLLRSEERASVLQGVELPL